MGMPVNKRRWIEAMSAVPGEELILADEPPLMDFLPRHSNVGHGDKGVFRLQPTSVKSNMIPTKQTGVILSFDFTGNCMVARMLNTARPSSITTKVSK